MTDYRKQIYERVKHGYQLGATDKSAILLMIEEIEQITLENKNLKAQIQYLEYQLSEKSN